MTRKVPTDNEISDRDIKVIAKHYGFEPQIQPDGTIDLDPNIYLFARAMVKEFEQVEVLKRKELSKELTRATEQLRIALIRLDAIK